jgi:predicted PurR-regulated permease PerM
VAHSLTLAAVAGAGWILFELLRLVSRFFTHFSAVFLPLFTAALFAVLLRPFHRFWMERARLGPGLSVAAVFVSVFVPLLALLWVLGGIVFGQAAELAVKLPAIAQELRQKLEDLTPAAREMLQRHGLEEKARGLLQENMASLAATAQGFFQGLLQRGAAAAQSVSGLLGWAVMPVYLAYLLPLRPARRLDPAEILPFLKPKTRDDVVFLAREFVQILVTFFRGQFLVALLQGLVYGTLYTAAGLKMGFVIGLMQGLLNVVPFVGTIAGVLVAGPVALLQEGGGLFALAKWAAAFGVGQVVESYYITPKVMGERTGLHPLAIMVAIFFWGTAFEGVVGIFLAIPLTAFGVVAWRLLRRQKYITPIF